MNAPSPAAPPVPARGPRRPWLELAGFLLLWVAFLSPPRTLSPSLDASWQMMLDFAHDQGLQFGRDLVPTMGPAGFLIAPAPSIGHLTLRFAWLLIGNAILAGVLWSLGRRLDGPRRWAYVAFLFLLIAPFTEAMHGLVILALGLGLLRPAARGHSWRTAGAAVLLGVLALFKFTHFNMAAAVLVAAVAYRARRDGARPALLLVAGFALGFAGGWRLLGQPLEALWPFFRLSVEISRGYVDGMSLNEDSWLFALGVGALLLSAAYAVCYWRGESDRARAHASVFMLAAAWFINWKHGFVRADGHTLAHFLGCLFPALAFPALLEEPLAAGRRRLLVLLAAVCTLGIFAGYAPALTQSLATLNTRVADNLTALAELRHPHAYAARARAAFGDFAATHLLPRITAIAGSDKVDVFGTEQSIAMLGQFHYTPRPVFQNYYAYTALLARTNEAFYASIRAPRFVLQKFQTIDGRLPAGDDARALVQLFTHYSLVADENGWLLWERQSPPRAVAPVPISESEAAFGQAVAVPEGGSDPLWVRVEIRPTFLGRLREFFYKPPQLGLRLVDTAGTDQTYRLVRAIAGDGFLLQPNFTTQAGVLGYFSGRTEPPATIRSLTVVLPAADRKYFAPGLTVSFGRLPPLARPAPPAAVPTDSKFRMFSLAPARVDSPHPAGPYGLDGREVFFIHAPGEIEFDPDMAVTHFRGEVGLPPDAYKNPNHTDGVEIVIEHVTPGGRRTILWQRYLDPFHRVEDRGLQPFSLTLPGKGRVFLRNLVGPKGDPSYDWTLWADLRFE